MQRIYVQPDERIMIVLPLFHTPTHKVAKMTLHGDATLRQRAVDLEQ